MQVGSEGRLEYGGIHVVVINFTAPPQKTFLQWNYERGFASSFALAASTIAPITPST
jgi:hypothetical protein